MTDEENETHIKASEQIFDDSIIYVTKQGSQVRTDGGRIVIWDVDGDEGELGSFPVEKLDTINVFGNINFTTPFITEANECGIVLNYFGQHGSYKGSFIPEKNTIAQVRLKQYGLTSEEKLAISKEFIHAKIRNSRILLNRKGIRETDRLKELEEMSQQTEGLEVLRGYEGDAAEEYFDLLDNTLTEGWTFEKRTRRPPEDHINSLLSLTYVMIKNEILSALRQYNLDPFLGIMHKNRHGRPALALDLQEEFRSILCDAFAVRLINKDILTHSSFKKDNRLNNDAFQKYLEKFDDYMQERFVHPHFEYRVSRRKAIRMQAILVRKRITGEMEKYHPLEFNR